jgi:uncharacterized metal-binding protein
MHTFIWILFVLVLILFLAAIICCLSKICKLNKKRKISLQASRERIIQKQADFILIILIGPLILFMLAMLATMLE